MTHSIYVVNEDGDAINSGHPFPVTVDKITRVLAFSTTTPLAGAGVYTSPTIDAINYKLASGFWLADQSGSYVVQHSDDGVTFYSAASNSVTLNTLAAVQNLSILGRYIRFVYTNGATLQGSFHGSIYLIPL